MVVSDSLAKMDVDNSTFVTVEVDSSSRTGMEKMSMDEAITLVSIVLLSAIVLVFSKGVDCDSPDTVSVIDISQI